MPLTREQIIKALGDDDDALVAELIATGATGEELAEARAGLPMTRRSSTPEDRYQAAA